MIIHLIYPSYNMIHQSPQLQIMNSWEGKGGRAKEYFDKVPYQFSAMVGNVLFIWHPL